MPGALDGVRVVDFGHYIAGPLAAVMLSDQGADVIHVDRPDPSSWRPDADAFLNRGKWRITLDLKQPDDLATARRLVDRADVLIENFRPGVMKRLGLDLVAARERNPRLMTCSLPGFAADAPAPTCRPGKGSSTRRPATAGPGSARRRRTGTPRCPPTQRSRWRPTSRRSWPPPAP
jgi:crotonobetainyl-CoA:carnitine CoA-transferase CaiB-like acyl-CoA transferase